MNAKIERVNKEIEKTKGKVAEQQARLRELDKQKTELENLEIVNAVRGMNISFDDLAGMLKQQGGNGSVTSGQVGPKSTAATSAPATQDNDDDKEDSE